jgi:hypothetical protein
MSLAADRPRWWQWPTVLSLDAPAVSVVWQLLIAHTVARSIDGARVFVLGASVWLAYAADRWLEAQRLEASDIRTPRHHFYYRHRVVTALTWGVVLAANLGIAVSQLTSREIRLGIVLLAAVLAYVLSHQYLHRKHPWRVPKELCVAGLLTGGVAVFLSGSAPPVRLVAPLTCFALLCFTNVALISMWERDVDLAHDQTSLALRYPALSSGIRWLPWIAAVIAVTLSFAPGARPVALCAAVSAVALGAVDLLAPRMGWPLARVLADAVLLTPLVLLWRI